MSGTVNAQIPLSINPPRPQNMLETASQVGNVARTWTGAELESQLLHARQGIGRAWQGAIDPNTGEVNVNQLTRAIAQDPKAAILAGETINQARQQQLGQIQIQQQQAVLGVQRLGNVANVLNSLTLNPNVTRQDVIREVTALLSLPEDQRPFSRETAAAILATMPTDQAQLRQWLQQKAASTQASMQNLVPLLPQGGTINNGAQQLPVNRSPVTGAVTPAPGMGPVENMPTPAERNNLVPGVGPRGEQTATPRSRVAPMEGGLGTRANPSAPGDMGTGRHPGTAPAAAPAAPGAAPATAPPAAAPSAARPSIPDVATTGLPPGVAAAREQEEGRMGAAASELATAAAQVPAINNTLAHLDRMVRQFTSGQGADWRRIAQSFGNTMIPGLNIDPKSLASQEEFNKLAFRLVNEQFRALGGSGSNDQFAGAVGASPSELLSRRGNLGIIAMMRGNNDALAVMQREWEKFKEANPLESYGKFLSQWNQRFDPRVFQIKYMTPEERGKTYEAMNPEERANYRRALKHAIDNGWIQVPRQAETSNAR